MPSVVLQAVKIKIHFGVLLHNALLHFLKANPDMLWYLIDRFTSIFFKSVNPPPPTNKEKRKKKKEKENHHQNVRYILILWCDCICQGVGYPLDIVVCSALGADMYDCVYPTRTARFGSALVPEVQYSFSKL